PEGVAPYAVEVVRLGAEDNVREAADDLYQRLVKAGVEVLYDDRDESAGKKFADADLIGVPVRVTVSKRTLEHQQAEVKRRDEAEAKLVDLEAIEKAL
ncbi:MAG TPA: His/Gly/Thr/Pro-type tRNA ligase C-terminal domain-containing protein, partial [Candidatus Saccharimonadia bacterium]|nr:His/Gly/Thr/Pro-type tRNA ligase C-terminal domain-containing protein [Candidatus Saccharimonadia bacterium]